jgi:hypothetical protein
MRRFFHGRFEVGLRFDCTAILLDFVTVFLALCMNAVILAHSQLSLRVALRFGASSFPMPCGKAHFLHCKKLAFGSQ